MNRFISLKDSLRIKRYYAVKINNGMGYVGSLIDKFIFRMVMFLTLFIYLYIKIKRTDMSIIITLFFIFTYSLFAYKINSSKSIKNKQIVDEKLVVDKVYRNLMNKSTEKYIEYVKEILGNCGVKDMENTIRKDLDLIGVMDGEELGIKCYQYSEEHKVDENDMKNFFIEIRDNDIKTGIIITTSSFSEDAMDFFDDFKNMNIKFMTIKDIIDVIRGTSLYPEKKDIEKMILKELDETRLKVKNEGKKIISKDNTKSCIVAGILIILFAKITIYTTYYKIFGIILITLGLVPLIKASVNLILSGNTKNDKF